MSNRDIWFKKYNDRFFFSFTKRFYDDCSSEGQRRVIVSNCWYFRVHLNHSRSWRIWKVFQPNCNFGFVYKNIGRFVYFGCRYKGKNVAKETLSLIN